VADEKKKQIHKVTSPTWDARNMGNKLVQQNLWQWRWRWWWWWGI